MGLGRPAGRPDPWETTRKQWQQSAITTRCWAWTARLAGRISRKPTASSPRSPIPICTRMINRLRRGSRKSTRPTRSCPIRRSAPTTTSSAWTARRWAGLAVSRAAAVSVVLNPSLTSSSAAWAAPGPSPGATRPCAGGTSWSTCALSLTRPPSARPSPSSSCAPNSAIPATAPAPRKAPSRSPARPARARARCVPAAGLWCPSAPVRPAAAPGKPFQTPARPARAPAACAVSAPPM